MYTVDSPVHVHFITDGDIKAGIERAARRMKTTKTQVMNTLLAEGLKSAGFMNVRKVKRTKK